MYARQTEHVSVTGAPVILLSAVTVVAMIAQL
jgi:hypothetical protein